MNFISDIYTTIMEKVMPILQENWQLALIGLGMIYILGAILNWKWTWDPTGHKIFGFNAWVYGTFGEKGARINTAIIGIVIIICTMGMWTFL